MRMAFLDANVFFAAVRSSTGGSYFLLELAKRRRLIVVTVAHALAEAERNIAEKLGSDAVQRHYDNLLAARPRIQSLAHISPSLVEGIQACNVPEKDIPIVAGAFMSRTGVLITLDRKHLLSNDNLADIFGEMFTIMTPGDYIKNYVL